MCALLQTRFELFRLVCLCSPLSHPFWYPVATVIPLFAYAYPLFRRLVTEQRAPLESIPVDLLEFLATVLAGVPFRVGSLKSSSFCPFEDHRLSLTSASLMISTDWPTISRLCPSLSCTRNLSTSLAFILVVSSIHIWITVCCFSLLCVLYSITLTPVFSPCRWCHPRV